MIRVFQKRLSVVVFMSQALILDTQLAACHQTSPPPAEQTYVGEGCVGEEREAFEQILVVIVLDHRRSVGLEHKRRRHD